MNRTWDKRLGYVLFLFADIKIFGRVSVHGANDGVTKERQQRLPKVSRNTSYCAKNNFLNKEIGYKT